MEVVFGVVGSLATQVPMIAVLVVGIVLALMNRQRLGRASTLALIGLVLFLADMIVGTGLSVLIPALANEQGWSVNQMGVIFGATSILRSLVAAAAFGCLLAAIFGRR